MSATYNLKNSMLVIIGVNLHIQELKVTFLVDTMENAVLDAHIIQGSTTLKIALKFHKNVSNPSATSCTTPIRNFLHKKDTRNSSPKAYDLRIPLQDETWLGMHLCVV
ncbi:hypothetical protein AKJ57_00970 [candidate division MSBL1 archaeon SCGC-AAA259A05]|uniref:Uncharacterized protein n=1 Tax=candidate division MSBL1 archaeon SCGC-AAA259A05 TaxID=1698259 RepID=A0A133UBF5_9EURY|nr:hypothetical protein AKJ57_00970 [candidate division MSBL1 archaeon SCGC-AAA259A05]